MAQFIPKNKYTFILGCLTTAGTVIADAAGAHKNEWPAWKKSNHATASRYGMTGGVGIIISSLVSRTVVPAALIFGGTLTFSGPIFYRNMTDREELRKIVSVGGILYILGWASLAFL